MRVSKSLQALTKHATLDKQLFRSKAIVRPTKGSYLVADDRATVNATEIRLNPAFERFRYMCCAWLDYDELTVFNIQTVVFRLTRQKDPSSARDVPLQHTAAAHLNATEPPVNKIRLEPHGNAAVVVENKQRGVTVLKVMQALCTSYKSKAPPRQKAGDFFRGWKVSAGGHSAERRVVLRACWGADPEYLDRDAAGFEGYVGLEYE